MYILLLLLCLNFYSNLEFSLCQNVVRVCRRHFIQALEKDINSGIRGVYTYKAYGEKRVVFGVFKFGALPTLLPFNLRSDAVWITFRNIVVMETHEKIKIIIILLLSISICHLVVCRPGAFCVYGKTIVIVFTILVL